MADANLLLERTFDGAGYPGFTTAWPGFTFPSGTGVNPSVTSPVVDGYHRGGPSRTRGTLRWRGLCDAVTGRPDYGVELSGLWKNAGGAGDRELGIVFCGVDVNNCLVARVRSMATASPQLRLFKIVSGVATQLGSTHTGADLSASQLNVHKAWRAHVEHLADGTSRVRVYLDSAGAGARGTLRIDVTTSIPTLRGGQLVGAEIGGVTQWGDAFVHGLRVYDLADEWTESAGEPAPGTGWMVELGNTLYRLQDLNALGIRLLSVRQAFSAGGAAGNEARFRVDAAWRPLSVLGPGRLVRIWQDGVLRFRGEIGPGSLTVGPRESQSWTARDAMFLARKVVSRADDRTPAYHFNIVDPKALEYDSELQGKTVGWLLRWLFERHLSDLRSHRACAVDRLPWVQAELDALDAVPINVALRGTFPEMVQSLLRYHMNVLPWVDPETLVWRFIDVTSLTDEALRFPRDVATWVLEPDPERSRTRIVWRGGRREPDDLVTLRLSSRDAATRLKPRWTMAQQAGAGTALRRKGGAVVTATFAGTGTAPHDGLLHAFVDVGAGEGLLEDEFIGGVAVVVGENTPCWIVDMTSTRIWLNISAWSGGTPPSVPTRIVISLTHPDAVPGLSMNGVGTTFVLPPSVLCPTGGADTALVQHGFCGSARVTVKGDDGKDYTEAYQYNVFTPNAAQRGAGFCDSLIQLAEQPKPSVGLSNRLPPAGGSPPLEQCAEGTGIDPVQGMEIEVEIPRTLPDAAELVEPPDVGGRKAYRGLAYSDDPTKWDGGGEPDLAGGDWGVTETLYHDDPDFNDEAGQGPGLRKAMQAALKVLGEKAYLLNLSLATPWDATGSALAHWRGSSSTARFAGLGKRVALFCDDGTPTGFSDTSLTNLPVYSVTWSVADNRTELMAGTLLAWLQFDAKATGERFGGRLTAKDVANTLKAVEDYRNAALAKPSNRVGASSAGATPGCNVSVVNENTKRVKSVQADDEDKEEQVNRLALKQKLGDMLFGGGVEVVPPQDLPEIPGLDGPAAKQFPDGAGAVPRPLAQHDVPFQGPSAEPNGDRGKYSGLIETDKSLSGGASPQLWRTGDVAFVVMPAKDGRTGGGVGLYWSPVNADGIAAGPYTRIRKPADLPDGVAPLKWLAHGSTQQQLVARTQELARRLGVVEDAQQRFLLPGEEDDAFPDGAPVDLATSQRVAGLASGALRMVGSSFTDPGGPVYEGPMNASGAHAGLFWRVHPAAYVLARVEPVTPGAGTNGGAWAWDASGPGDTTEYMLHGGIVHKQIDAGSLRDSGVEPVRTTPAASDDPFCLFGVAGRILPASGDSGAGGILSMPATSRGSVSVTAHLKEYSRSTPASTGATVVAFVRHASQASAWSSSSATTPTTAVVADGSGTGTGVFRAAGGAVPPGLRKPFDLALTVVRDVSAGTSTAPAVLTGIGVDVAVVEGGYLIAARDGVGVADALQSGQLVFPEVPALAELLSIRVTKNLSEGVGVGDVLVPEANPVAFWDSEGPGFGDALAIEFEKNLAEGVGVSDDLEISFVP